LVWPEQTDRLANLRAAIKIAAAFKPRVVRGDLRDDLDQLAEEAPRDATLVIFHTAVLAYVSSVTDRRNFARKVRTLCPYWISNETPQVFPDIARQIRTPRASGNFLLAFIRRSRELGFTLDEIRTLLALATENSKAACAEVRELAAGHLEEVRAKIADLRAMERVLAEAVRSCDAGELPGCPMIDALSATTK
jgi:MerR, DNA binding/Uncharacterized protein conserved in bacteria (DUF2332)